MKILLFGPNGQVGWELQRALAPLGEMIPLNRDGYDGLSGDLAKPERLRDTIRRLQPAVIVNAAAYTAVDRAEAEPESAHTVNAAAPGVMAEEAAEVGALLVHYSTDYVFDGSGERPKQEDEATAPLNVYGRSKLAGEQAVRSAGGRHLIFRTAWVYAARGHNFLRTMLKLAAERESLQVIDDQHGAPTGADFIADATAHAIRHALSREHNRGTYHLTAAGETTWHGYATFLIEQAHAVGLPVRVSPEAIERVSSDVFPKPARRPHNSRLDGTRLERTFDLKRPDWRAGVARTLRGIAEAGNTAR